MKHTEGKKINPRPPVMLASLITDAKMYILPQWLCSLNNLTYKNFGILLADTSGGGLDGFKTSDYLTRDHAVIKPPQRNILRQTMAEALNAIREQFFNSTAEYLLILECDEFPPINVIEKLVDQSIALELPVISVPYLSGFGYSKFLIWQEIVEHDDDMRSATDFQVDSNTWFKQFDGKTRPVYGCGIGCCLIQRWVVEKIPFRWMQNVVKFPDILFNWDLNLFNIPHYADTSMLCVHENQDWAVHALDIAHKEKLSIMLNK